MAKQYYICDIIGTGDEFDPYRPAVADLDVSWSGSIPTGTDGKPLHTWALVIVATANHAAVRAHKGVNSLPDFPLDGKVSAINVATKAAMAAAFTKRGIPTNIIDGKDGYREVIRAVGQRLEQSFDENAFDISDV